MKKDLRSIKIERAARTDRALQRLPARYIHEAAQCRMMLINLAKLDSPKFDSWYGRSIKLLEKAYGDS